MPARQDESISEQSTNKKTVDTSRRHGRTSRRQSVKHDRAFESDMSWLGRLWYGIRRLRDATEPPAQTVVERGTAAAGDVRNPCVAIPADIMFSPQRASLYSSMVSLLVRNPYYISRIVYNVKYHECDALLSIILNSLFGDTAHEPSLIALFNEIIEMEVDRTTSIETLMRNDAPSLHVLSSYLRNQACLEYLQIAVRPTVEVIVQLGNVSLDPELAAVYQDWVRTQRTMRLPLVVSAVEAASYTEVQNLSRRRHRHLLHVATHCLFDITTSRHRIPAGLVAICTSTLQATRRKFTDVNAIKGYSLVGGMFFLRFVNAALTTPSQYGLLDSPPTGTVNSNLKLVARLMQRLSNNSGKMPDEWPLDARKFMKANIEKFHSFLESLTSGSDVQGNVSSELENRRVQSAGTLDVVDTGEAPQQKCLGKAEQHGTASAVNSNKETESSLSKHESLGVPSHRVKSDPWMEQPHRSKRLHRLMSFARQYASERPQQTSHWAQSSEGISVPGSSAATPQPMASCAENGQHAYKEAALGREGSSSTSTEGSSLSNSSPRSMFDMGQMMTMDSSQGRRPSRSGASGDVTLPLNDLYLLQKYLLMYEDTWMSGEANACLSTSGDKKVTPMQSCLRDLGPAPALVRPQNNHRTRIPLE
ncbi:RasGAP protein [Coemansia sp. RSA 2131]|nr:RasGAP protein [Coemansia sp. RSA 2131]